MNRGRVHHIGDLDIGASDGDCCPAAIEGRRVVIACCCAVQIQRRRVIDRHDTDCRRPDIARHLAVIDNHGNGAISRGRNV